MVRADGFVSGLTGKNLMWPRRFTDDGFSKPADIIDWRGADTAAVARATPTKEIFNTNKFKRLEVRGIICMPLKKRWWD